MRTSKSILAGVAAGALGMALVPMVGVTTANAAESSTVSPVRQVATTTSTTEAVPYAAITWAGSKSDDTVLMTLTTATTNGTLNMSDTQVSSGGVTYGSDTYGQDEDVNLSDPQSDDTTISAITLGDDSAIYVGAQIAGTYGGQLKTYNDGALNKTIDFSFTTTGAASAVTVTINKPDLPKGVSNADAVTVGIVDASGNPTQLSSVDSVAIETDETSASLSPTSPISYKAAALGSADVAITTSTTAGTFTFKATPQGTLSPTAVTGTYNVISNVLARKINMTDSSTALNGTNAVPPSTAGNGILVPGTTTVPFNITASDTEAGSPLLLSLGGTAIAASTSSVTIGSDGTAVLSVPVTAAGAVDGKTITVSDGVITYTATYKTPQVYCPTVSRSPSAANIALAAGSTQDVTVSVDDSFGNPAVNWVVTATGNDAAATEVSASTNSSGEATLSLPDKSTTTTTTVTWSFETRDPAAATGLTCPDDVNLKYSTTGEVTIKDMKFNTTLVADFTTKQTVPYNGRIEKNGYTNGVAPLMKVTATVGVADVNVTLSGDGVLFCSADDTYTLTSGVWVASSSTSNGCTEGSGTYTASSTTLTAYVSSTSTGAHTITATTSSGDSVSGSATWQTAAAAVRNVAISANPAKQSIGQTSSLTVSVTDVFGNGTPLDSSNKVTLQTDLGTLAGGVSTYDVTATNSAGQATVSLASAVSGLATITATGSGGQFADLANDPFTGAPAAVASDTAVVEWTTAPTDMTITISGERTTVKGKPGIAVDGITTGISEGEAVIPYIKFPGETSYSAGSARPKVDAEGEFYWQRKTGKKIYVYFVLESDMDVRSERIIIQAK